MTTSHIHFVASDHEAKSVTVLINSDRWEYFLPSSAHVDSAVFVFHKSAGKGLAYCRKFATQERKVNV